MKDKKKIENKAVTKKEVSVQRTGGTGRKVRDHYHEKHKKEDKPTKKFQRGKIKSNLQKES